MLDVRICEVKLCDVRKSDFIFSLRAAEERTWKIDLNLRRLEENRCG